MQPDAGQYFYLTTQGCKVNQYESQAIRELWTHWGARETVDPCQADFILINSCAVTERAILDLEKLVRSFASLKPKAKILVLGCAVEADTNRILSLPGVDLAISQQDKRFLNQESTFGHKFSSLHIADYNRARAVIKVQDGCSHGCTYCIIPATRGPSVSRLPEEILAEVRQLLQAGLRELTLCGINLRHYGRDLHPKIDLWDLVTHLDNELRSQWTGRARIRLSSLEPGDLHPKTLETLANCSLVCPHLHLSLQSGSPQILKRMGRGHYGPEQVFDFLDSLSHIWPMFGLGADIITGFPGETENLFQETLEVVTRLPLSYAHIFPYSERPGTPAATFPDTIPNHLRRERAKTLRHRVQISQNKFLQTLLKVSPMHVVLEAKGAGMNEFYIECQVQGQALPGRNLLPVTPLEITKNGLCVGVLGEGS